MRRSLLALLLFALAFQGWGLAAFHFSQASPDLSFLLLLLWGSVLFMVAHQQMLRARTGESLQIDAEQQKVCYHSGEESQVLDWNCLGWSAVGRHTPTVFMPKFAALGFAHWETAMRRSNWRRRS